MKLIHNTLAVAGVLLATALSTAMAGAGESAHFHERADPQWRPAYAPRASDVVIRSLRPRGDGPDEGSQRATRDFHATRHEWVYLRYWQQGGDDESSRRFVAAMADKGVLVGGAGSGSSHHVERFTDQDRLEWCVLNIDGSLYTPRHKQGWPEPPGQGSVFSDEYFRIHLLHYSEQLDLGAQVFQRDEARMSLADGFDFGPAARVGFQEYLRSHTDAAQREAWGIGDLDNFDVRDYFLGLDPPDTSDVAWFRNWRLDDPVRQQYDRFKEQGVIDFFRRTRAALDVHAGRRVPFSCNNTSFQLWEPVHREFDWGLSELMFQTAEPGHLYERFHAGRLLGKVQVVSTPKPRGAVTDPVAFRRLNRQVIAQAYSLGGLCKVPWDLFLQTADGQGRYYGEPEDYADLYGFVRAMAPYLEGFEEAAAAGKDLPIMDERDPGLLQVEGSDDLYVFLRVRPGDVDSPLVIHVVNWAAEGSTPSVAVRVSGPAMGWDAARFKVRLAQPAAYDAARHQEADRRAEALRPRGELRGPDQAAAYADLIESTDLIAEEQGGDIIFSFTAPNPWSVIIIEPMGGAE